jgi:hypothetical protein
MAEGEGTHTAEQQNKPDKRLPWWKRLWRWTEFGKKSGWDLLQLLIVPLALAIIGFLFTMQQDARQQRIENQRAQQAQKIENQRAEAERELAEQRAQDEALQAYLDQMGSLLLERDLRASEEDSEVRALARARTLTVLGRLDPSRKTALMQFLVEADLVHRVDGREPIISLAGVDLHGAHLLAANLSGADLYRANLSDAYLVGANLSDAYLLAANPSGANLLAANLSDAYLDGANLSDANLSDADLSDASLSGANLSDAYLDGANLSGARGVTQEELEKQASTIEGATMPPSGQYVSNKFKPAVTFEIGEDWYLVPPETPGRVMFETVPEIVARQLGGQLVFTNPLIVFDPSNLSEPKELPEPENGQEWVSWFQSHPNLETSKPVPESVGGVSGMRIDVTCVPLPQEDASSGQELPCSPPFPIREGSILTPGGEVKDRYIIVDVRGETVLIDVAAETEGKFDEFLPKAQKVLDSVEWKGG